mmetsp:Transcript_47090/g.102431  ORF Transcript_47090/g.102431 Transcript_47090/m.102431 type:complete len:295 (+) Transcript_47090:659-1543(+)
MPTRSALAPASSRALACTQVTTFPAIIGSFGNWLLIFLMSSTCTPESPLRLSRTTMSTPASDSFSTRAMSRPSSSTRPTGTAAPTRSCLLASREAWGYSLQRFRSLRVIRARSSPVSLTMGSFPTLALCISSFAAMRVVGSVLVTGLDVITVASSTCSSCSRSTSREVTIPSSLSPRLPLAVIMTVENPRSCLSLRTSPTVLVGFMHTGSRMKPFSKLFTFSTIFAWASAGWSPWIIPRPPSRAMLMAMFTSVTVSIGLLITGFLNSMPFTISVVKSTSWTPNPTCPGRKIRSS